MGITKATLDAAVRQAKEEARREYTATISRLKAEASDLRIKLDAEIEAGKRSIENELDKSKAGGWRDRPKTIAGMLILAALMIILVTWLAGKAQATEPLPICVTGIPADLRLECHQSGMWVYDSDSWLTVLPTGMRCARPA